jgi:hypothetical protein
MSLFRAVRHIVTYKIPDPSLGNHFRIFKCTKKDGEQVKPRDLVLKLNFRDTNNQPNEFEFYALQHGTLRHLIPDGWAECDVTQELFEIATNEYSYIRATSMPAALG